MSDVDAGSLPIAGLSAYAGIVTTGKLARGQRVLIHAGAGGVGSFAVQLAKHLGATVAATAGSKNVDFVRSLGADQVIDYTKTDFSKAIKDVDLVFDLMGGDVRYQSFPVLKAGRGDLAHFRAADDAGAAAQRRRGQAGAGQIRHRAAGRIVEAGGQQGGEAHGHRNLFRSATRSRPTSMS